MKTLDEYAKEMAELANSCCYRSDGWEEELFVKFKAILEEVEKNANRNP